MPAYPVPQVGGWRLPVQLWESLRNAPQVRVEQAALFPQLVGHDLPVAAHQRPALHVHQLRGTGVGHSVSAAEPHRAHPPQQTPLVGEQRVPFLRWGGPAHAPPGGRGGSSGSALWPRSRSSGCSLWGWQRPGRRSQRGTGHIWGPGRSPGGRGQGKAVGWVCAGPQLPRLPITLSPAGSSPTLRRESQPPQGMSCHPLGEAG